jgi:hypothetical protein
LRLCAQKAGNQFIFINGMLYRGASFGMMRPASPEGSRPVLALPRGGVPERPKGADCKSAVIDFEGSNPSPTTIFRQRFAEPELIG